MARLGLSAPEALSFNKRPHLKATGVTANRKKMSEMATEASEIMRQSITSELAGWMINIKVDSVTRDHLK